MASPLGRLFGKSPVAPVQQHMQLAQESVQRLCELFAALGDADAARAAEIHGRLETTVNEARKLRHDIREHLPRGLLLAMPRADLLHLLDIQHAILTRGLALATPLALRGVALPKDLRSAIDTWCSHIADAADKALTAIRELDEILEMAFVQRERGPVNDALDALRSELEHCEEQYRTVLGALVAGEAALAPVDAALLYASCAALADVARRCSDVGDQLELLLAR